MKKSLLLASVAFSIFTTNVNAIELKPYIGFDYVYSNASTNDVVVQDVLVGKDLYENNFHSLSINVGTSINDYFDIEAFYQKSADAEGDVVALVDGSNVYTDKIKTSFYAYGVDAIGHLPLSEKFTAIVDVTPDTSSIYLIRYYILKIKKSTLPVLEKNSYIVDVVINKNNEHFALRTIVRQTLLDMDSVDNMTDFSVGFRYSF